MRFTTKHLGFGTAGLTSLPSLKKAMNLLNTAYDNGIRYFDTAPIYGKGYAEVILGKFLYKKEDVVICTKFGLDIYSNLIIPVNIAMPINFLYKKILKKGKNENINTGIVPELTVRCITKKAISKSLELSLKRLKVDRIDTYLLHEGLPFFLTNDSFQYLMDCKKSGIINRIGVGTNLLHILPKDEPDLNNWTVLQYQKDSLSDVVLKKFPNHFHIHHSCLQRSFEYSAGEEIAKCVKENPNGRILFFTSQSERIINNIKEFEQFMAYSKKE